MLNEATIDMLSVGFTSIVAIIAIILQTTFGSKWLDKNAQRIGDRIHTPDIDQSKQFLIDGLRTLEAKYKDGELRHSSSKSVILSNHLKENPFPSGESLRVEDEIIRLELVDAGFKGVDAGERDVSVGFPHHIHAVMRDGSRKIVGLPGEARERARIIEKEEKSRKRREKIKIVRRIKDMVRFGLVGVLIVSLLIRASTYLYG